MEEMNKTKALSILELEEEDLRDVKNVRKAFRKMSLKWHPDKTGGNDEYMKKINLAHNFLLEHCIKDNDDKNYYQEYIEAQRKYNETREEMRIMCLELKELEEFRDDRLVDWLPNSTIIGFIIFIINLSFLSEFILIVTYLSYFHSKGKSFLYGKSLWKKIILSFMVMLFPIPSVLILIIYVIVKTVKKSIISYNHYFFPNLISASSAYYC